MLQKELNRIVKEHLPDAVAGEMKEFITQAKENEKLLKTLEKNIDNLNDVIGKKDDELEKKEQAIKSKSETIIELTDQMVKCENCKERYMRLEYEEMNKNIQVQCANDRINDAKEFVALAFKSPQFRKEVIKDTHEPIIENGCQMGTKMTSENTTEKIIEE
jgi:NAD-dependent SIR2 family protein deacetylase